MERLVSSPKPDAFALPETAAGPAAAPADAAWLSNRKRDAGAKVSVEVLRGRPAIEIDGHWRDLVTRADEQNVFMQPAVLRAAEPDREIVTLLAWHASGKKRLVGIWAFCLGTPHLSILPIAALYAPPTAHAYLSTPVIDRDCLDAVLDAMFAAIADDVDLPKIVSLESMSGEGATYDALLRVIARRNSGSCRFDAKSRPLLKPGRDAASCFDKAVSGSSRKKLRQRRRRLAEQGRLETRVARSVAEVQAAFDAFLVLEAKGWKGAGRTALASDPDKAAFARAMVTALARSGDASVFALELDGNPVSMQIVLRAGRVVYTWKTAYDEACAEFSPGMLLFEDYSKAFLADPGIACADSCAFDETGFMATWTERKLVADLWLDALPGMSGVFSAAVAAQQCYLPLRRTAKQFYLRASESRLLRRALAAFRGGRTASGDKAAAKDKHLAGAF